MGKFFLLLVIIIMLFSCKPRIVDQPTPDAESVKKIKKTVSSFIGQRLGQLEDSIKTNPFDIKFMALKKVLSKKLEELQ